MSSKTTQQTNLWPSEINELILHKTLNELIESNKIPNITGLPQQLIVLYHGNLSSKCINFTNNNTVNRTTLFKSPKPTNCTVDSFTIEVWLNVDKFTNKFQVIRNGDHWGGSMIHFQFFPNTRILELARHGSVQLRFHEYNFNSKQWYHVAVTYPDGALYVNGKLICEHKQNTHKVTFTDGHIGEWYHNNNFNGNRRFFGKMKEFRIWNTIRTQTEINENMLIGAKSNWMQKGLICYFSLDNDNIDDIKDLCDKNDDKDKANELLSNDFQLNSLNI